MFGSILRSRFVRQHASHLYTKAVHHPSRPVRVSFYHKSSVAAAAVGAKAEIEVNSIRTNNHDPKVEDSDGRQPRSKPNGMRRDKNPLSSAKSVIANPREVLKLNGQFKDVPSMLAGEERSTIENDGTKSSNNPGNLKPDRSRELLGKLRFHYATQRIARKKLIARKPSIPGPVPGQAINGEISGSKIDEEPDKRAESAVKHITGEKNSPNSTKSRYNPTTTPDHSDPPDFFGRIATNRLNRRDKSLIFHFLRNSASTNRLAKPLRYTGIRTRITQPEMLKTQSKPESTRSVGGKKKDKGKKKREKAGITASEMETIEATGLQLVPISNPQPPVPRLAYGLERVLFNPGVYQLQDPRSRVFNFDPYLQSIMPVADFDFGALKEYITSSRDEMLTSTAAVEGKKYTGSTSSMTSALAHFHFLLSQWRPINATNLSQGFPEKLRTFTLLQRAPSAIFLRWKDGTYAIDADKEFDSANILMMLGKSMEKLLTLPTSEFERYRKQSPEQATDGELGEEQSYHYTTMGDFLMRSQLDAYDPRVPGTGMFDLKTRAVISIRMDTQNYHVGSGYEIRKRFGEYESYEREYYDMIRAAFLKYSLQVRMGRMDGIFVAFHNVERIFGFQYISLSEMDSALHGQDDLTLGDSEFKLSLELLNRVLDRATTRFPKQSLRLFFETRDTTTPFMYIFAEPIGEDQIQAIQQSKRAEIEEFERAVLGIDHTSSAVKDEEEEYRKEVQAKFEEGLDCVEPNAVGDSRSPGEDDVEDMTSSLGAQGHLSNHRKSSIGTGGPTEDQSLLLESKDDLAHTGSAEIKFGITGESPHEEDKYHKELGPNLSGKNVIEQEDSNILPAITGSYVGTSETNRVGDVVDSLTDCVPIAPDMHQLSSKIQDQRENTIIDGDTDGSRSCESEEEDRQAAQSKGSELLALTLKIRNKINRKYVVRPTNIGPDDHWSIDYAFTEVQDQSQARHLYEATKRRRATTLHGNKVNKSKSRFNQAFTGKLRELSEQGRRWRQKQTEIDQSSPVEVLRGQNS